MISFIRKTLLASFALTALSLAAIAQQADPPPVDPGDPNPPCTAPVPSVSSLMQCGFAGDSLFGADVVTVSVPDIGCTVEWYLASAGTANGPVAMGPTFNGTATGNDTLLVRYVCDTTCVTEFTRIPWKVLARNNNQVTLTPSSGVVGDEISLVSVGLASVLELRLNDQALSFRRSTSQGQQPSLVFTIPPGAATGKLELINSDTSTCAANTTLTVSGSGTERRIANGILSVCSGIYTDPQGADANYNNNLYVTQTLNPATAGAKLQLDFTQVQLSDNDQLYVYNGPNASSPLLFRSVGGSTAPGKLVSTHATGALTVRFYSNGSGTGAGFSATSSCLTSSTPGPVVSNLSTASGVNGQKVTITGSNLGSATQVRFGIYNASFTIRNSGMIDATIPFGATTSYVSVETPAGVAPSASRFRVVDTVMHFAGSTSICNGLYTDPQGAFADYLPNLYQTLTLNPTAPSQKISLVFSEFDLGTGDQLYIYDGTSTSASLLFRYVGGTSTMNPDTIKAKSSSGALTVRFYSNSSGGNAGWQAALFCSAASPNVAPARLGDAGITAETFAFWPNPAHGKLTVRAENLGSDRLMLIDATGKAVYQTRLNTGTTEVQLPSSIKPGLYTVKCGRHTARLAID